MPQRFFTVIIILASNMIKKILILSVSLMILGGFVFADTAESQDFVYLFHLYYDNGQLFADRDVQFKYDVLPEIFVPEVLNTQFPHKGEIVNLKGEIAETFQFDPRQGNPKFLKGTLLIKAPYVPDGQKAIFYNNQGDALLTIFVSESSFCNDDGVCNSDVGEDTKTCPSDCKASTPVPTTITTEPSVGGLGRGVLKIFIYFIIGLCVLGSWWYWRRKKQSIATLEIPTI